jgi:ADP-heptose:LPS heptosyltransferase
MTELSFYFRMRTFKFDLVHLLETNSHYTIMAKLIGARLFSGFENKLGTWMDHTAPWDPGLHFVKNQIASVEGWTTRPEIDPLFLVVTQQEREEGRRILERAGVRFEEGYICIHPGTSAPASVRRWIASRYAGVADALVRQFRCAIVFTGTSADEPDIAEIRGHMTLGSVVLAGKTDLRSLMAVLAGARLLIGPDTGTMHVATALGTPVLMLMGSSNPADTGPYHPGGVSTFVRVDLPCSPCVERNPMPVQWETCKTMRPVLCMSLLTQQSVADAASRILRNEAIPANGFSVPPMA